jgi:hypothetical protein
MVTWVTLYFVASLMGYCQGCCAFAYISIAIGSSQEEGSEGQADDHGYHKGSFYPSYIQEEDGKKDIRCSDKPLLE